jgi:hypothetical protein
MTRTEAPEQRDDEMTMAMAFVVYGYTALILALPFLADADPPFVLFLACWLGGSGLAGALVPHRWMFALPLVALAALFVVMMSGYVDTEFLSDPLSSIALFVLAWGELAGLAAGYAVVKRKRES